MPGGKRVASCSMVAMMFFAVASAFEPGRWKTAKRHRRIAVEIGIRRIVLRGELDARHVLEPDHGARRLLDHDVGELVGIGEAPERLHRDLECALLRHRRLIEHAARDLDVLRLQRQHDVARGQAERLQPIGIEPDAHRIVAAAEHGDRADAVDARQRVGDLERGVVGDEQAVARLVGRIEVHDHHQVGRALGHRDADVAHVGGKSRLRDRDAILHLHLRDVEIGAEIEGDRDGEAAVRRRIRRHVDHVLDAVDLLLDRRRPRSRRPRRRWRPDTGPDTLMMGGAISGYCATGSRENDTPPMITNTIETTAAKIGRSMKKCEMRIGLPARSIGLGLRGGRLRASPAVLGCHLLSRTHPHQAVDDDAVVRPTRPSLITRKSSTTSPSVTKFCRATPS